MGRLTEEEAEDLLAEPEIAVLSVVNDHGAPEGTPVWFEYRDKRIQIMVGANSHKARCARVNPLVSVTLDTRQAPYRGICLRGTVTFAEPDGEQARRIARHYLGEEMGDAYIEATAATLADQVLLDINIDSSFSWDYSKGF
ncbi:MAG: pyridoxamine 5'-phosphate oxidase family protein [Proteobacteria bacterium]|nr:pyridoxamine 5'-phosphate oxidase family protein [Pseudomonadota bacterium]